MESRPRQRTRAARARASSISELRPPRGAAPPQLHHTAAPSAARHAHRPAGIILSLNVSLGGVPKLPVAGAWIGENGVEGDRQRNLTYHGGPLRAVSIYSAERIAALRDEGHPVLPGSLGENLTIEGLPWERVVPGVRLALGAAVMVEVTAFTVPCRTIQGAFADRRTSRVSQKVHSGWSRVYARVVQPGRLDVGDPAVLL